MSAHVGANTSAGEFSSYLVCGSAFEPLGENRYRERGWIRDQEVNVVGFAVEFDQLSAQVGAHGAQGVLAVGEHGVGEHPAPVLGDEHQVRVQQRHAVPVAAVGRGCQWAPLRLSGG